MACPLCGDRCTCSAATTGKQIAGTRVSVLFEPDNDTQNNSADDSNRGEDWRGEVANRVQAHRAKRQRRYDPESSLSLSFTPAPTSANKAEATPEKNKNATQQYHQTSSAPELHSSTSDLDEGGVSTLVEEIEDSRPSPYRRIVMKPPAELPTSDDNVIEFPRSVEQDLLFAHELAESISATPRILESPEVS